MMLIIKKINIIETKDEKTFLEKKDSATWEEIWLPTH